MMGPLMETQKGNKYILLKMDPFKKCVGNLSIKNQLAETVGRVAVREFVARVGVSIGDS